jgi:predicted 3-demethylubiquinone-9 3-methyltransferase (glyoxalase superfamily)
VPRISPNLWFDNQSLEAAEFYCSIFPNSKITAVTHYGEANPDRVGDVLTVSFELDGQEVVALNGGPIFQFSEAVSLIIDCKDQAEVDYYWEKLTADGGEESMCGWLKDKFGFSWQVVPAGWVEMLTDPDPERVKRATEAMYQMRKLDIAALEKAAAG